MTCYGHACGSGRQAAEMSRRSYRYSRSGPIARRLANLLFYPDLVLTTLRMRFLMRALDETEVPYYRLAAIVGLQKLVTNEFDEPEERKSVRDRLLTLIEQAGEAIRAAGVPTLEGLLAIVLRSSYRCTSSARMHRGSCASSSTLPRR